MIGIEERIASCKAALEHARQNGNADSIIFYSETIAELQAIKAKMDICSYCNQVIENEADMRFDLENEDKFYHKACYGASAEG